MSKDAERITYTEDGKLDEVVTGDVHIERLDDSNWHIQVGGLKFFCQDLILSDIQPEIGRVPDEDYKDLKVRHAISRWRDDQFGFQDLAKAIVDSSYLDTDTIADIWKTAPAGIQAWAKGSAEPLPTVKEDFVTLIEDILDGKRHNEALSVEAGFQDQFEGYPLSFNGFSEELPTEEVKSWLQNAYSQDTLFLVLDDRTNKVVDICDAVESIYHGEGDNMPHRVAIPDPVHARRCFTCGSLQFLTYGGWGCGNGHGGADGVDGTFTGYSGVPESEIQVVVSKEELDWYQEHRDWFLGE